MGINNEKLLNINNNLINDSFVSAEVVIHVCDELKSAKKDFVCNQRLLVEKMGYFADVTAGITYSFDTFIFKI